MSLLHKMVGKGQKAFRNFLKCFALTFCYLLTSTSNHNRVRHFKIGYVIYDVAKIPSTMKK